jgi:NAD(P) transhydrogenase subunit alpha
MKPGSVIVDMSVVQGGNVEGSKADERVLTDNGVTILGFANYPSRLATDASALFARNLLTFVTSFWDKEAKTLKLPEDDEIIQAIRTTAAGQIVHPALKQ